MHSVMVPVSVRGQCSSLSSDLTFHHWFKNTPQFSLLKIVFRFYCCICDSSDGFSFFKKYILLIMLLQLSHFPPFTPFSPAHTLPPTFPTFSSCPWVIHVAYIGFYISYTILTLPLSIFYLPLMLLNLCTFPSSLHLPLPC